ncbi:DDE-type integrase/transposase/recombinase [Campylobacter sp. RM16191]|uniref:DDE-type integrase/transposase/recombinase n=1 Tax=Campylobacter sp. RM16191 TaxID=1705728 RepID=UPI001473F5DE|nr:DDE-type integrase/transposase/recombinase [Campylobacter sp. RM16191]
MNSFEVAKLCACTPQNIRKKTKQAANANKAYIKVKDMIFMFRMVKNSTGKAYEYIQLSDEIQPADVLALKDSESVKAISAATESIGSLNFMKKEGKNANSGNRENASCKVASGTKPSKRSGADDAKRGSINSGGSSETVKIPALCKEYEPEGLCGQDNGSRSVWMESERSLDDSSDGFVSSGNDSSNHAVVYDAGGINLPAIATCSDKKRKAAFEKYEVIKEWDKAKGKIKEAAFIDYINAKKVCSIKVTPNKLYDWQRKYRQGGLDALVDERTNNKKLTLESLGLKEYAIKLIHAQQGGINITNIYNLLNYEAIKSGKFSLEEFNGKKDEIVSYEVVNRFVNSYLNDNKLLKNIILYGEDGTVGRQMPSLGISNWAVTSINQIVEIDASPLDLICNASDICDIIGYSAVNNIFKDKEEFETYVKEWQKRYTIIALIDTYSGVATFHISDTENSIGIARAVAKYILRYGKPAVIKGDNGKAFKSSHINSVMNALEIEYRAVRAYSGWLKPYVERNFRALQHNFTANLAGFIGHNITQRQAIEFFYSKKERRLKKGYKTNLRELKNLSEVQNLMDMYAEKFLNTRYLERLEMSVCDAYNQKAHEAVAMDVISLSARLSKRELKSVNKKGISVGGIWYQNITMHGYNSVYANLNINNQSECFLWDEKGAFIDVAVAFSDELGSSVEVAKASQKLFNKRLKETKEAKTLATNEVRDKFINFLENVEVKGAVTPVVQAVNREAERINADLKIARAAKSNANVSAQQIESAKSKAKEPRKISVFEEMAMAKKKMA